MGTTTNLNLKVELKLTLFRQIISFKKNVCKRIKIFSQVSG
ncbi:hypothetical protein LEP1GSC021_2242 [Leptospira noguchii str. 1993005606]|nr:hypothetical protein LEP1GSC021_2242 [Leptospira noguchii str. 1993005606]